LSNYATINIRDELLRVPGVSDINVQGQRDYSVRIWLDPQRLAAHNMTALDVTAAIRRQNLDAAIGQVGAPPALSGQSFQLPVSTVGRLHDPEEFGDIIVKVPPPRPPNPPVRVAASRRGGLEAPALNLMTDSDPALMQGVST